MCFGLIWSAAATADVLRLATWHAEFSRKGPGLLLRDLKRGELDGLIAQIGEAKPDVLLLTDFDFDHGQVALGALRDALADRGARYGHMFSARPNTGMHTGLDIDGDGRLGGPRDAQGYGWFSGQGGQSVLSRFPVTLSTDLSGLLWSVVPDSAMDLEDTGPAVQRLSSSAHWALRIDLPSGPLTLLTLAATPPLFDGPEDRNGRRNRDEVLLWLHAIEGRLGFQPVPPFAIIGNLQLDPDKGEGLHEAVQTVLSHPTLRDPLPGVPTARFSTTGDLRVSYILPSIDAVVVGTGVTPLPEDGGHRLVWVDLLVSPEPGQ